MEDNKDVTIDENLLNQINGYKDVAIDGINYKDESYLYEGVEKHRLYQLDSNNEPTGYFFNATLGTDGTYTLGEEYVLTNENTGILIDNSSPIIGKEVREKDGIGNMFNIPDGTEVDHEVITNVINNNDLDSNYTSVSDVLEYTKDQNYFDEKQGNFKEGKNTFVVDGKQLTAKYNEDGSVTLTNAEGITQYIVKNDENGSVTITNAEGNILDDKSMGFENHTVTYDNLATNNVDPLIIKDNSERAAITNAREVTEYFKNHDGIESFTGKIGDSDETFIFNKDGTIKKPDGTIYTIDDGVILDSKGNKIDSKVSIDLNYGNDSEKPGYKIEDITDPNNGLGVPDANGTVLKGSVPLLDADGKIVDCNVTMRYGSAKGYDIEIVYEGEKLTYKYRYEDGEYKLKNVINLEKNELVEDAPNLDTNGIFLHNENYLWDNVKNGKPETENDEITFGGITDVNASYDAKDENGNDLGFKIKQNYHYLMDDNLKDPEGFYDNFGATEQMFTEDRSEALADITIPNIHDFSEESRYAIKDTDGKTFASIEDAALELSSNGTISYADAKEIVKKAVESGTRGSSDEIITADFTIASDTNIVEKYLTESFITEYDNEWKEYLEKVDYGSMAEFKSNIQKQFDYVKEQCNSTIERMNGWLNNELSGNGATSVSNAVTCIKGKIENLYANISGKFAEALETLDKLVENMDTLNTKEDQRKELAAKINESREKMRTYNGNKENYQAKPNEFTGNYTYYKKSGEIVATSAEWEALGDDKGNKVPEQNKNYQLWIAENKNHEDLFAEFKKLVDEYLPFQDEINGEINFIINFADSLNSFANFFQKQGDKLSSAEKVYQNFNDLTREFQSFTKYPVFTSKNEDYAEGDIVYLDNNPNNKYIVTGYGWDDNGQYMIIERIDPVTGKIMPDSQRKVYDTREISKPTGWNNPIYAAPVATTAPPAGTTAPPKTTKAPTGGTTAPPAGTTAPPAGTTAPPVATTAPHVTPTVAPTVAPTVIPTVIPTIIPTIPSIIPDIDDPVSPAIPVTPTIPITPVTPTTPGQFIPHTGLEDFASKEVKDTTLEMTGLAGLGIGALGLGAAATMGNDKEEKDEEREEHKEEQQQNYNQFPNAWNHVAENNSNNSNYLQ